MCVDEPIAKVCHKNKSRKDVEVAADMPITQPHIESTRRSFTPPLVLAWGDKASWTWCQPCWMQASPVGPCRSYSGVGCLAALCNSSPVPDTVQVCPLWPRLPWDCVNSPANLRKYPAGNRSLVFNLKSHGCGHRGTAAEGGGEYINKSCFLHRYPLSEKIK